MDSESFDFSYAIAKARATFAAWRVHYKFQELCRKAGFNPSQLRVPAGNSDGGQWTNADGSPRFARPRDSNLSRLKPTGQPRLTQRTISDGTGSRLWRRATEERLGDGSLVKRTVENRDRSRVKTSFSHATESSATRSVVVLPDGTLFTFEAENDTHRIFDHQGEQIGHAEWTQSGPIPQATVQSVGDVTVLGTRRLMEAGRLLYNSAVEFGDYLGSVFAFRAWDHNIDNAGAELTFSGSVERDKVEALCPELPTVQALTDEAARFAGDPYLLQCRSIWDGGPHKAS